MGMGPEAENEAQLLKARHQLNRPSCDHAVLYERLLVLEMDAKGIYIFPGTGICGDEGPVPQGMAATDVLLIVDEQ